MIPNKRPVSQTLYTDIDSDFEPDPKTGDVKIVTDRDCIRRSILRIVSLNKYDIPFNTNNYSQMKEFLFEIPSHTNDIAMKTNLEWIIGELEPRVRINEIEINYDDFSNEYTIDIFYTILRMNTDDVATKTAKRVR